MKQLLYSALHCFGWRNYGEACVYFCAANSTYIYSGQTNSWLTLQTIYKLLAQQVARLFAKFLISHYKTNLALYPLFTLSSSFSTACSSSWFNYMNLLQFVRSAELNNLPRVYCLSTGYVTQLLATCNCLKPVSLHNWIYGKRDHPVQTLLDIRQFIDLFVLSTYLFPFLLMEQLEATVACNRQKCRDQTLS